MKTSLWPQLTHHIGIDLGTARTRIWVGGQGVVLDEPSVMAVDQRSGKVVAVGTEAAVMAGRVGQEMRLYYPVREGMLFDAQPAQAMLRIWLRQVLGFNYLLSPVIMASLPAAASQADRAALVQLMTDLGAREVLTISQPLAAAIGSGVPIADASGTLIFHLGAGQVETALISLGSVVASRSSHRAGQHLDQLLRQTISQKFDLKISSQTARQVKHQLGRLISNHHSQSVTGQDQHTRAPKEVTISAADLQSTLVTQAGYYEQLLQDLLAVIPPELTVDVLDKGMLLSGGLAQLTDLDAWLVEKLGVAVALVDQPEQVVINGIGTALEHLGEFKESLGYQAQTL